MKELFVNADGKGGKIITTFENVDIPTPKDDEVLIKVVVTGTNPKDWKYVQSGEKWFNIGDDIAGVVEQVGSKVLNFKKGDRVAGMHVMFEPHGSYAEYAIAPASTTFHLPASTTFEEAATIPLVALTAAIGMYQRLNLPPPWNPAQQPTPFVVYGASSAVGLTALKFAKLSRLSPVIAIAGSGAPLIKEQNLADVVIDYRHNDHLAEDIKKAAGGKEIRYAFDAICLAPSSTLVSEALATGGAIAGIIPYKDTLANDVQFKITYVGGSHKYYPTYPLVGKEIVEIDREFAYVFSYYLTRVLENGTFKGHPYAVIEGGLDGIGDALESLKEGKVSAKKLVARIAETKSL